MEPKMLDTLESIINEISPLNIVLHTLNGSLGSWLRAWRIKALMVIGFLKESEGRKRK